MPASVRTQVFLLCFLIGSGVAAQPHASALAGVGFCLGAALCCRLAPALPRWAWGVPLSLALGGLWLLGWRALHRLSLPLDTPLSLRGVIVQPADVRSDKQLLTVRPLEPHSRGLLLVSAPRYPSYSYGDVLAVRGTVEAPETFNGFNYPLYLERFGIGGVVRRPQGIRKVGHDPPNLLLAALYGLRLRVEAEINRVLPEPESSFLAGLLLGSRRAIPADVQAALQATGTSHIIAISGANITIVVALLLQLLPVAGLRSKFWVTALIAGLITLLTGASASVVRGSVVAVLGSYLRLVSRRAWATPLILFSAALLVLGNPLLTVADPGFQLSFAAFAGLACLGTPCADLLARTPLTRAPPVFAASLAETVAATIGTAPISLAAFGQLSLLGLVVNPLILWLLVPVTFLGLLLVAGGWIPLVAAVVRPPLWLMLHAVLATITWFGGLHVGLVQARLGWLPALTLYVLIGLILRRSSYASP